MSRWTFNTTPIPPSTEGQKLIIDKEYIFMKIATGSVNINESLDSINVGKFDGIRPDYSGRNPRVKVIQAKKWNGAYVGKGK